MSTRVVHARALRILASLILASLTVASLAWPMPAAAQTPVVPPKVSAAPAPEPAPEPTPGPITVQIAPPPISISSALLGISLPLGAQSSPGKPMYAEFVTEHRQSFTDGNRISRSTSSCIYRDTQGRIRRESQLSIPGLPAGIAAATFITIVDRQLGYGYVLNPQEMVAHRYELNAAGPSYLARLSAKGNGRALLPDAPSDTPSATFSATSPDSVMSAALPNSASVPSAAAFTSPGAASSAGAPPQGAPTPAADSAPSHWRLKVFAPHRLRSNQDQSAAGGSNTSASNASSPSTSSSNTSHLGSGFLASDASFTAVPTMRMDQSFITAPNPMRTEDLGEQTILGFRALGTRVITTLPAGQIGNDRPIDIVSEQWFSPELDLVMRSLHRDPWAGEFTTTVTRISREDQAAALFEIPAPYKIIDAASEAEHHVLDGHGSHAPGPAPW